MYSDDYGDNDQFVSIEDDADAQALLDSVEEEVDQFSQAFINKLVGQCLHFAEVFSGNTFHSYQRPLAHRIVESIIINDGAEVTALASRQSGKSEIIANVVSALMVLLPRLAKLYPDLLGKFKDGVWVGLFAPIESQAETVYGRVVSRLTSPRAIEILGDPEIDDITTRNPGVTKGTRLKNSGSLVMMMTANPRAKIESKSFHVIIIDECQDADDFMVAKSIMPMGAYYNATKIKTGTPTTSKNNFYRSIQLNKRTQTGKGKRQNHFQWDWKVVAKANKNYEKFVRGEMLSLGEESDEFQMSYCPTPDTRILTADLRHVPAGDIQVGDKLVGFDEERPGKGAHRRLREAVVEDVGRLRLPCYTMTLSDGTEVTCSGDHQWLVTTAGRRTVWKRTKDLVASDRIFKVTEVWEAEEDYRTGYLAAAFDGEGHFSRQQMLGFSQLKNRMHARVRGYLGDLGFRYWEIQQQPSGVDVLHIAGGRSEVMRFLGQVRPDRLLSKLDVSKLGTIGRHLHEPDQFQHPYVVSLKFVGDREVVAIKTSTKTYVAEGLASHNCCKWLLERGMFISSQALEELGDLSQEIVRTWHTSPVIVGVDPARKLDSTVVTVVWVDWDRPDEYGYYDHRILNWLEIQGDDWEEQYFQITNFLANYDVLAVGVDSGGVGDAVAQRLALLMPRTEVIPVGSSLSEQSKRWKHLQALVQRRLVGWPAHAKTRRLRAWKRFQTQMQDAEKNFNGPNMVVAAPDEAHAHDDYVDSLAIACSLTLDLVMPTAEQGVNPFYSKGGQARA